MSVKVIFADLLPGETPIDDVTGLKAENISTRAQLSLVEGENIRKAILKHFFGRVSAREGACFDLEGVKALHKDMYGDVWDWAGHFRRRDLNLGCPWTQIQEKLYNLFADIEFWGKQERHFLEQATELHHRAVQIHPFVNGNGRWARMLTNLWLAANENMEIEWPETIGAVSHIRDQYIAALKAADEGEMSPLLEMHRAYLRAS